ncbi:MAG: agmatinase [Candidatus Daviesbacteria bacterium]|nr:agmatinase [Candidatus Daviesbacteria bacterium]
MSQNRTEPPFFGGCSNPDFKDAKAVILPIGYEGTSYGKTGSKEGPEAIINASRHIETYDIETGKDLADLKIFTMEGLVPSKNSTAEAMADIKEAVAEIIKSGKLPIILGGEHSITLGVVQAIIKKYPKLSILHLDAHADQLPEFEGTKIHHATVMRRIADDLKIPITSVGIRSMSSGEAEYLSKKSVQVFYAEDYPLELPVAEIIKSLPTQDVYLTFDLDFLDPAFMPSTGTPVPGGYNFYQTLPLLKKLIAEKNLVGVDLVELLPNQVNYHADVLAAQLSFKILCYKFR